MNDPSRSKKGDGQNKGNKFKRVNREEKGEKHDMSNIAGSKRRGDEMEIDDQNIMKRGRVKEIVENEEEVGNNTNKAMM